MGRANGGPPQHLEGRQDVTQRNSKATMTAWWIGVAQRAEASGLLNMAMRALEAALEGGGRDQRERMLLRQHLEVAQRKVARERRGGVVWPPNVEAPEAITYRSRDGELWSAPLMASLPYDPRRTSWG